MAPTWFKLILVVALIVVLFGKGRVSDMMGDLAKGIKSFKSGLKDRDETATTPTAYQDVSARLDAPLTVQADRRAG